jgi:very-short-patch-repair endonuclease
VAKPGEMLVAILKEPLDFTIARDQHWYRIPVESVEKMLKGRWPPRWVSFYQTMVFSQHPHCVFYYARVQSIRRAFRWQLFPDRPRDEKWSREYFQLLLDNLQQLPKPIYSRRWRRIVFIPTTLMKFKSAVEINDLYAGSTLEDKLWAELRRLSVYADRQELVSVKGRNYLLDFAVYCVKGKIDIETDGDRWHHNPEKAKLDNYRDNDLVADGWQILRFTGNQIRDQIADYCLPKIVDKVNNLDGVKLDDDFAKRIDLRLPGSEFQLGLFDSSE